jgi:holo-[acyl-carrier protein] synthase
MIYGIGVDHVSVEELRRVISKGGDNVIQRIFSKSEYNYCMNKANPYQCLAARFAAKEAFMKAIGLGIGDIPMNGIIIKNDDNGKPYISVKNIIYKELNKRFIDNVLVSLSHIELSAVAIVLLESY